MPFERFSFFGKQLFYIGAREFFDSVIVMGDIDKWDFLAVYALGSKVMAVSGSPSRSKQLSILR